ncbi:MAG TPA: aspartate aminotransferase family protein [Thermoplasmata archaeon]|nr:aspartate aminotransferase family protein [Thermoplasmata archaeon]
MVLTPVLTRLIDALISSRSVARPPDMEEEWLSYPDAPRILTPPPGPRSRELLDVQGRLETDAVVYSKYFPLALREGRGSTVEDLDGNRYIDWVAGVSVLNLGHRHPRLVKALERQAGLLWHSLELPTEARIDFLKELEASLPGSLRQHARVLFTVTGGDAVETAVNLADHATGRHGTVTFSGAYHGVHGGAVNLTSGRRYHTTSSFHGGTIVRVPYPDPYRPVLGPSDSSEGVIRYLQHLARDPHSGVDQLSAVLVEPILGEGGYVVPPDDFLPSLREFCTQNDLLLIADEIQTGLGRTGRMWAVEHSGVTPDILCIAKTIGGGIPVSMVAYRDDLVRELPKGFHLGTYRGNPLALAVGAEVLRVLREGDLIDRTAHRGRRVADEFRRLAADHPAIGDVRGKGFMIGVEFVRDHRTRVPWPERARAMRHELFQRGVLMHTCGSYDQCLRFMSPLTIEDELLDRGLRVFGDALDAMEEAPSAPRPVPPSVGHLPIPSTRENLPEPRIPGPFHPTPAIPPPPPHLD